MSKVSLRVYNREIEGLIEGSQLDEAIAHCQHILKTFPMYVEIYRLLGKTFLEARKYTDAADIFQRALMSVPDDFVSHVGMSIIRDDEGKLDDAIWHMERAFEIQPSNSAIQSELRRLYGRRDGVEPPKIRLSRDALANMYSQGELFNQAIAEIRAVLADDPNRPDLQVMLARSYYRAGQKVEAAEMAAALLKKFPYCLDALRVLVDVLPGTTQGENTQIYRHRLGMLDPYSVFAKDSAFASDQVADSAVSIDRLDYRPGALPASNEPDWASSLGIRLDGEKRTEAAPAWLQPSGESNEPPLGTALSPAGAPGEKNDAVPEWMQAAGWQPSSADHEGPPPVESEGEPAVEPAAQADIPDWVKSMAPAGLTETENKNGQASPGAASTDEGEIPDWLKAMKPAGLESQTEEGGTAAAPAPPPSNASVPPHEPEEIPDWLKSMAPAATTDTGGGGEPIPTEPAASEPAVPADIPDWLNATASAEPAVSESHPVPMKTPPAEAIPGTPPQVEMPDWLNSVESKGEGGTEVGNIPTNELEPAETADIPDWLRSMAPSQPVIDKAPENSAVPMQPSEPTLPPEPSSQIEMPDWLKPITSKAPEQTIQSENPPVEIHPAPEAAQPNTEADFPDWLRSLKSEDSTPAEPSNELEDTRPTQAVSLAKNDEPVEPAVLPEWLSSLSVAESTKADASPVTPPAESLIHTKEPTARPVESDAFVPSGEVKPLNIGDDALGWLESLAAKQGANPEELLTKPEDRKTSAPEGWLPPSAAQTPPPEKVEPPAGETTMEPPVNKAESPEIPKTPLQTLPLPSLDAYIKRDARKQPLETLPLSPLQIFGEEKPAASKLPAEETPSKVEPAAPVVSKPEETTPQPVNIENDTMAWLERLAANQGAKPEELLTKPEERPLEAPEWTQEEKFETPAPSVEPPASPTPVEPEQLKPVEQQMEDVTITTWLNNLESDEVGNKPVPEVVASPEPKEPEEELPDWLRDMEKPVKPSPATPQVESESDLPDWLQTPAEPPVEANLVERTEQPSVLKPVPEQEAEEPMPDWMREPEKTVDQAAPTEPDEWVPMEEAFDQAAQEKPEAVPKLEQEYTPTSKSVPTPEKPETGRPTSAGGNLAPIPAHDKDSACLEAAQAALDKNSLDAAVKEYAKLIKKGHLLEEVIHDLKEATYRFPVDAILWQTLGDAYMRANRLQDALDGYTKAEELLR